LRRQQRGSRRWLAYGAVAALPVPGGREEHRAGAVPAGALGIPGLLARLGGVQVEGCEEITARWLPGLSWLLERLFMEREFRRIWALGWRRLRRQAGEVVRVSARVSALAPARYCL
jgi:hypothetical protein